MYMHINQLNLKWNSEINDYLLIFPWKIDSIFFTVIYLPDGCITWMNFTDNLLQSNYSKFVKKNVL